MNQSSASTNSQTIAWDDLARQKNFETWLQQTSMRHQLQPDSLRIASADASFRRYFRINDADGQTFIIMDAPVELENSAPFVKVAGLMQQAGIRAPEIFDWQQEHGFMLMSDLGKHTIIQLLDPDDFTAARPLYEQALDILLLWQQASRPDVLPPYDQALLQQELQLFPDWYIRKHRKFQLDAAQKKTLQSTFDLIIQRNLAAPKIYVHRDYMPRNLMIPPAGGPLGLIDFQDAVCGPITYDIASLMRDAFLSWQEEQVLDVTIRYWERAKKLGLMDFEDWHSDFGSFWRAVEWMGLQRHLKVAGIFARISLRDGKPRYLADTPRFIAYIRHTARRYRELTPLLKLVDDIEGQDEASVFSFGRL